MKMKVDADFSRVLAGLKRAERQIQDAARKAVAVATDEAMAQSVRRAPIDTGALVEDHKVRVDEEDDGVVGHVYIPANAEAKDYALKVHEYLPGLGPQSKAKQNAEPSVRVGDKYLQRAIEEEQERYKKIIARTLKAALKG